MAKRARPNIHKMVMMLSKRVRELNDTDWQKLVRMIKYLNGTNKKYLTLSSDNLKVVKWYVDANCLVYPELKSHTEAIMIMGQRVMQSVSRKN